MFRIPSALPNSTASIDELTDYIEWECIKSGVVSLSTALRPVLVPNDEILIEGIEDESDQAINKADDIVQEMERRRTASKNRYPFSIENRGYTIKITDRTSEEYWIYVYLLLSTRLNMFSNKIWGGIDGTKILEKLSSISAKEYFGERSESFVFGTATPGSFQTKIDNLITKIGEGHSFLNRDGAAIHAQDDKLDVVVWKDFSDGNKSKLVGFGQCKTGTSWDDKETIELQPKIFCEKWFRDTLVVDPVKMFFTSQYFPLNLYPKSKNAGLVFDRSRIIDYLPRNIDADLLEEIRTWCSSALGAMIR